MRSYKSESIRNVALLSHSKAGKTSLSEAILFNAGHTTRLGRVEDGNTTSDYEPEEVNRGGSIQLTLLPYEWNDTKVNMIDTPGYADFFGEVVAALKVADSALLVVCAASGIEVGTELMWGEISARELPAMILLNKMDRENADFAAVLERIKDEFGRKCVAIQLPIGAESDFKGVIDLITMKAKGPDDQDIEIPADLADQVRVLRDAMAEAVAECDDDLTMKYLEGEELTEEELVQGLAEGVKSGAIVPVMVAAAQSNTCVKAIMDNISAYMPSPIEKGGVTAKDLVSEETITLNGDGNSPMAAFVFKTAADPFVGKLSYFRVYSDILHSDSQVWNSGKNSGEKISQLFMARGKSQENVTEVVTGDIGSVAKLSATSSGDTLCNRDRPLDLGGIEFPSSPLSVAVLAKSKSDIDKLGSSLARLVEEDPTLKLEIDPDTGQMLLWGMGEAHIDTTLQKLDRKFSVEVVTEIPRIPYKETITIPTKSEYKHKKQTGGHGQYGHVKIQLEPMPPGSGIEFAQKVVGGNVPKNYIPAVEKGVMEAAQGGVLTDFPMVDVKVTLYDGSSHPVDSSDMSFKIAGAQAFRKGATQGNPALLEPVMHVKITVPDTYTGDVIGDLNTKRGRVLGMEPQNGKTVIEAEVPQAEIVRYAVDLRSITQGRGTYATEFAHYDELPAHLTQRIVEKIQKESG